MIIIMHYNEFSYSPTNHCRTRRHPFIGNCTKLICHFLVYRWHMTWQLIWFFHDKWHLLWRLMTAQYVGYTCFNFHDLKGHNYLWFLVPQMWHSISIWPMYDKLVHVYSLHMKGILRQAKEIDWKYEIYFIGLFLDHQSFIIHFLVRWKSH